MIRALALLALSALIACTPAAPPEPITQAEADEPTILLTLTSAVAADVGQPNVTLQPTSIRIEGDWAWVIAQPQDVDWSTTKYATQAGEGLLDGEGTTYALLQRVDGHWEVRDFVIGPTDVAYADWPQRYGAPASLLGF